ncbi:SufD family Fe-S cluster assembly protein [Sphingomonas jeddahensis]|uniref:FeS cluster assembly protein SufD n=1 Tax=Sphingomonas jeddahensis TaxID=1915074 RepID=A0A1V2EYZ6_9SPHN|nr:SufD family Fe-S cluster assembly protein [Sphingomonas jeddahensis]ONF97508.1 FeS cluster assembly protein SufD [Sphingomonas jeddahensis]
MSDAVLDLPSTREEAWRWADLGGLAAAAALAPIAAPEADFLDLPGAKLLFLDGKLDEARSDLHRVTLIELGGDEHALGRRATGTGWSLRLDAQAVTHPVQIVHVATGRENHLPSEIVLADDAAAEIVETFVGAGWQNRFTRTQLGKGARLMRSVRLLQPAGFVSLREAAQVGEAASLITVFLGAGGQGSRIDAQLTMAGEGAFVEYGGALLTSAEQKQECAVRVNHAQPNGASRQVWRAVAADRSAVSLAAAVEVARHAQKTDGEQSLRGLLLDRTATVNLKPELEIFADDVKCAHGATVGELDQRALFYMQSRGIPRTRAQAILTRAFVADALERIGDETVRKGFEADADAWLDAAL